MAQIVHTKIKNKEKCVDYVLTSNKKPNIKNLIQIYSYIRIFSDTNIRSYHIRIIFLIRIYSDIHSYHFFDTNIFGYSFVSFFWYEYIRIFVRIVFWKKIYSNIHSYQKFIFATPWYRAARAAKNLVVVGSFCIGTVYLLVEKQWHGKGKERELHHHCYFILLPF